MSSCDIQSGSAKKPAPTCCLTDSVTSRYMRLKQASPSAGGKIWSIAASRSGNSSIEVTGGPASAAVLVSIVVRLVRPFDRHADVFRLLRPQLRQCRPERFDVEPGDLFV